MGTEFTMTRDDARSEDASALEDVLELLTSHHRARPWTRRNLPRQLPGRAFGGENNGTRVRVMKFRSFAPRGLVARAAEVPVGDSLKVARVM
jgi:hypothetical protein